MIDNSIWKCHSEYVEINGGYDCSLFLSFRLHLYDSRKKIHALQQLSAELRKSPMEFI